MSSEVDGDLSDVNPDLLDLCKDATAWREQRRRAMRARIFGHTPHDDHGANDVAASRGDAMVKSQTASATTIMTTQEAMTDKMLTAATAPEQAARTQRQSMAQAEAYVLQQLQSHKRRRDAAAAAAVASAEAPPAPAERSEATRSMSLKDKLLSKYAKS